jgi:signal transduction histidine kinase
LWQQKVKDKSLPWLIQDLSFATTLNEAIINMEIKKNSELIIKNKELINKKSVLAVLLSQKTDELYKLNLQLQDELYDNQKYQRELEIAKKAGEQLNKMKSHFISNLSHEIRTPINGIIGLAQLIVQDHENAEEVQAFANLILDCSNRLSETVNRVLSVSRIENDAMPVQFENIEVIGFMKKLIKPLTILANQKAQNIIINSHSEELNMVSDKHYLGQIFTNLVSNAIKYTQEKGKIEINIKEVFQNNKSMFYFSVEDNGIGMERKVIDKIFDPFFTEKEVTKMSDNSVGLGLYLVKNYLQYLKGDITVKSEKGIGSLFYVTIPIE